MSFDTVTQWVVRCDGTSVGGQCQEVLTYPPDAHDDQDAEGWDRPEPLPWLLDRPALHADARDWLDHTGWLLARDGHLLCPRHVAAAEYLAHAAIDGLPFPDTTDSARTEGGDR